MLSRSIPTGRTTPNQVRPDWPRHDEFEFAPDWRRRAEFRFAPTGRVTPDSGWSRRVQFISMPPSTLIAWPVINVFSSEAMKTAAAAISSGSETRLRGIFSTRRARAVPRS